MFDYQTGYYEYNYRTLKEAQEAKKHIKTQLKIFLIFPELITQKLKK